MPLKEINMELVWEVGSIIEIFDRSTRISTILKSQL